MMVIGPKIPSTMCHRNQMGSGPQFWRNLMRLRAE